MKRRKSRSTRSKVILGAGMTVCAEKGGGGGKDVRMKRK